MWYTNNGNEEKIDEEEKINYEMYLKVIDLFRNYMESDYRNG